MIRGPTGNHGAVAPDLPSDDALLDGRYLVATPPPDGDAPVRAQDTRFRRDVMVRLWPDDEVGREAWGREVARLGVHRRDQPHLLDAGAGQGRCWVVLPVDQPLATAVLPRVRTGEQPAPGSSSPSATSTTAAHGRRRAHPTRARAPWWSAPAQRGVLAGAVLSVAVGAVLAGLRMDADAQGAVPVSDDAAVQTGVSPTVAATTARVEPVAAQTKPTVTKATTTTRAQPARAARRPVGPTSASGPAAGPARPGAPAPAAKAHGAAPKPHRPHGRP